MSGFTFGLGLAALFGGLLLLFLLAVTDWSRPVARGRSRRLLSLYTLTGRPAPVREEVSVLGDSQVARSAVELAGRVVKRRGLEEKLALELDRAGVPMRASEWLLLEAGAAIGGLFLLVLLTGSLLGGAGGAVVAAMTPRLWLRSKANRRRARFVADMPDALQLLSGSLSAGFSLPQGLDAVVREGGDPIAQEIGRALAEARLGVPIEDALDAVADRMDSEDFRWVVMAIRIQREVGGNLAEVLSTVVVTMRDRARLRRQVQTLSAEGRLSAYVLVGLPIAMTAYLLAFRRDYLEPLYSTGAGIVMIVLGAVLVVVGTIWMRKLIDVEV